MYDVEGKIRTAHQIFFSLRIIVNANIMCEGYEMLHFLGILILMNSDAVKGV